MHGSLPQRGLVYSPGLPLAAATLGTRFAPWSNPNGVATTNEENLNAPISFRRVYPSRVFYEAPATILARQESSDRFALVPRRNLKNIRVSTCSCWRC